MKKITFKLLLTHFIIFVGLTAATTKELKVLDIKIAIFTDKHSSISTVDYLTNMLKFISVKESDKLILHRKKCSAIIKYVVVNIQSSLTILNIVGTHCANYT